MTIEEILSRPAYYRSSPTGSVGTGWDSLSSYLKHCISISHFPLHIANEEDAETLRGYLLIAGINATVSTKLSVGMITSQAEGFTDDY